MSILNFYSRRASIQDIAPCYYISFREAAALVQLVAQK